MENKPKQTFNIALFLGLCVVAISIFAAAQSLAGRMPFMLHGNFTSQIHGSHTTDFLQNEFLSQWEAASFLRLDSTEFMSLLETGELTGTYTVFVVEREEWVWDRPIDGVNPVDRPVPVRPIEERMLANTVTVEHRIFSRERLVEWLQERIDG